MIMTTTISTQDLLSAAGKDDTLQYRVLASRIIHKSSVRINVQVTALVSTKDYNQQALEERILKALNKFMAAKWVFFSMKRSADAAGYERVTLTASTLVNPSQNWNLQERAREAGSEGLSLGNVEVNYASSTAEVDGIVRELRKEIVQQVKDHIDDFVTLTDRPWRIGNIAFGADEDERGYTGKGARRVDSSSDNSIEQTEMMDGSERITLRASVELRAKAMG
jgi:hypothetical protein